MSNRQSATRDDHHRDLLENLTEEGIQLPSLAIEFIDKLIAAHDSRCPDTSTPLRDEAYGSIYAGLVIEKLWRLSAVKLLPDRKEELLRPDIWTPVDALRTLVSVEVCRRTGIQPSEWKRLPASDQVTVMDGIAKTEILPSKWTGITFHGEATYSVDGAHPVTVTESQDCVLQAFLETPSMNKEALKSKSGIDSDPARILKSLTTSYEGIFSPHITLPGGKGKGGYSVKIRQKPANL